MRAKKMATTVAYLIGACVLIYTTAAVEESLVIAPDKGSVDTCAVT
jgi:hypothetical protein